MTVTGGAAGASQQLPAGEAKFGLRVPLKPDAENVLMVTATDAAGRTASVGDIRINQLSLSSIVVAQVTARRLSTTEVKAFVADGTIKLTDPQNFNVSLFQIALTIGGRQARVEVPVITNRDAEFSTGPPVSIRCNEAGKEIEVVDDTLLIPCDDEGSNGIRTREEPEVRVIPFESSVGIPGVPSVPGIILVEGRIKTLKEFFKVNLLLMNVSSVFTLTGVSAAIDVASDALSKVVPGSGVVKLDDLLPGHQGTAQFIIRGDKVGAHTVQVNFGAMLTGPLVDTPIPVAGSATTEVEVKGPPRMDVTVEHPGFVVAETPYTVTVNIQNTSPDLDALFTTLDLRIGAGAELIDPATGLPGNGLGVASLGDILAGQTVSRQYRVLPHVTGAVTSCVAGASENIELEVLIAGAGGGCALGMQPSQMVAASDLPTVSVLPAHNTVNVPVNSVVSAFFSAPMLTQTISAGAPGTTLRLVGPSGEIVPGDLQVLTPPDGPTSAVFQPTASLQRGATYTIYVVPDIFDVDGGRLRSGVSARFTTEGEVTLDQTAPVVTLQIEPPVNPGAVQRGQLPSIRVESSDDSGVVARVDLLVDGRLVDARVPQSPVTFLLDTSKLEAGTTHTVTAVAVDAAGNAASSSVNVTLTPDSTPPSVELSVQGPFVRGRSVPVSIRAADNTRVARVSVFLDASSTPSYTGLVAPFRFDLSTAALSVGPHLLRAVATDGAGNSAEASVDLLVQEDAALPAVVISSPANGSMVPIGSFVPVVPSVTDDTAVASVEIFLDDEVTPRGSGISGINVPTGGLSLGSHTLRVIARDVAGNTASAAATFTVIQPVVAEVPAPVGALISAGPPVNGIVTVSGGPGAIQPGLQVQVLNSTNEATATAVAGADGAFSAQLEAAAGDVLSVRAIDASRNESGAIGLGVPEPARLLSITVSPAAVALSPANRSQQLSVIGTFDDASQRPVVAGVTFTVLESAVASVTSLGLLLPGGNGETTVRVELAGVAPVLVPVTTAFPTVVGVVVSPASVQLAEVAQKQQLTVRAEMSDGSLQPFQGSVEFGSTNTAIASVDTNGLITAVGEGAATVVVVPAGFDPLDVEVTVVANPPVLSITKTHTGNFAQGQQGVTYTVRVSNAAGAAASSGTVTVTETVPSGLTLVSMAGDGWQCAGSNCSRSDSLPAGGSYAPIVVTANVDPNAASPRVNSVVVSGGGSGDASAIDSTVIITPNLVTNGTFDANANGWALVGACEATTWAGLGNPPGSLRIEACGATVSDPTARQALNGLTPGKRYLVSVDVRVHNLVSPTATSFGIFLDAQPANPIALAGFFDFAWHTVTASFTATNPTHTLIFGTELDTRTPGVLSNSDVSYYIDNVSVIGASLTGISVSPAVVTLAAVGDTRQLAVTGTFSDGATLPISLGVVFSSSDPAIATVSTSGVITAVGTGMPPGTNGSTTITVSAPTLAPVGVSARVPVTVLSTSPSAPCVAPPAGLVAWWRGDLSARDSVTGSDASIMGGATFAAGRVGQAFAFDGVLGHLEVPGSAALDVVGPLTLSAWVNTKSMGKIQYIAIKDSGTGIGAYHNYQLWIESDGSINFGVGDGSSLYQVVSVARVAPDAWYHIAAVYDMNRLILYVNGVEDAGTFIGPRALFTTPAMPLRIGIVREGSYSYAFEGLIDEVQLFNVALSQSDIESAFSAGSCDIPAVQAREADALTFSVLNLAGATGGQPLAREATALPFSVLNTAVGGGAPVAAEAHTVPFSVLNTAGANGQPTAKEAAALPLSVLNTASASVGPPVPFEAAAKPFSALNLSGPGNGQMVWSLLVSNRGTNSIMQYDAATGAFIRAMVPSGAGGLNLPDGILVGPTGDLFAASNRDAPSSAAVLRFNGLTGGLTGTFVPTTGGALNITSMVFGPNGNLFVSDFLGRDVKEYDQTTGAFVRVFAGLANNGCCAQGLAFGPNGNLYVATQASVQEFHSATGAFVKAFAFGAALNPTGVAFGPDGNIYVSTTNGIQRYNPASGELVGTFVAAGLGGVGHAHSLRFGIDGRLYVADTTNNRVLRFDGLTGAFIDEFVSPSGGLSAPFNLTFGWVGR